MYFVRTAVVLVAAYIFSIALPAAEQQKLTEKFDHIIVTPDNLQWRDAPNTLPPGAKIAVLEGDPASDGVFTMRLKLPAGYRIPPHWHPGDERVSVISGTFFLGFGDKFDPANGMQLPAGSFFVLHPKTPHFAWVTEETVIQIYGTGPWGINFLKPAEGPGRG